MRIGSLFAGIGGLELGLERAGVGHTVWQVEIDPFCREVLARHWPDAVRYEDVTEVDWSGVEPVEVLCGGFPCQPFSIAGGRRGVADDRWMWPAFADCIRVARPRYVVVENVTSLVRDADAFGWMLGDLHECGFDAWWDVLPASAFGAPHRRTRLFLVAHPPGEGLEGRLGPTTLRETQRQLPNRLGKAGMGWPSPPRTPRVGYGLPDWVDRVKATGTAVVPQVAEVVGRRLLELIESEAA
jgi:DNA (cytosine-5)-methyltransferase 1